MDEDLEAVEIVFAQRLASGEPTIRRRAFKQLERHIYWLSQNGSLNEKSTARLCKGLHYAMWMQDKMILQEELADDICKLMDLFINEDHANAFASALIFSLSKEWPFIDHWRMDKFLMLIRRLFRRLFVRLRASGWNADSLTRFVAMLEASVVSPTSCICESLKFHCASVYLDELNNAAENLSEELAFTLLKPYINILSLKISDSFFRSVSTEIFDAILLSVSQQLVKKQNDENEAEMEDKNKKKKSLNLNYSYLGEALFAVGSSPNVNSKRRKHLYKLVQKFQLAAKNMDPYQISIDLPAKKFRKR